MLAVAEIPIGPIRFNGVIAAILLDGQEYRLATYLGAKAAKIQDGTVVIRQGALELTATLLDKTSLPLRAPANGQMTRTIRESAACHARYRLRLGGDTLIQFESRRASFEFEYK